MCVAAQSKQTAQAVEMRVMCKRIKGEEERRRRFNCFSN